jgi:hypothetical protein
MITVSELSGWLAGLNPGACVAVDEGGLALVEVGTEQYLEVGGVPFVGASAEEIEREELGGYQL